MIDEKQIPFPASISKTLFSLLMIVGILLFVVWTVIMFLKSGRILDWGIYSICIVMVLMGLFGRLLYSAKEKQDS